MWICHNGAGPGMIIVAFLTASAQPRDNKPNTREPKANKPTFHCHTVYIGREVKDTETCVLPSSVWVLP